MPLPCDQVLQWMFQHAPPGYRCLRESRLAALRADKPERLLYTLPSFLSSQVRAVVFRVGSAFFGLPFLARHGRRRFGILSSDHSRTVPDQVG